VGFKRSFLGVNSQAWYETVAMVLHVQLTNHRDHFFRVTLEWMLFSQIYVHSLIRFEAIPYSTLKIKIFLWYLYKGVILIKIQISKTTLARRQEVLLLFF